MRLVDQNIANWNRLTSGCEWRFGPTLTNGAPIAVRITSTVNVTLAT